MFSATAKRRTGKRWFARGCGLCSQAYRAELNFQLVAHNGEPWFVAKDVCIVLDIQDHHQAIEQLDDDERGRCTVPTPGGMQELKVISE